MQHPGIGHAHAKRPVTFREMRKHHQQRQHNEPHDYSPMAATMSIHRDRATLNGQETAPIASGGPHGIVSTDTIQRTRLAKERWTQAAQMALRNDPGTAAEADAALRASLGDRLMCGAVRCSARPGARVANMVTNRSHKRPTHKVVATMLSASN
jgi:hypothetical protein